MPEKKTIKRAQRAKRQGKAPTTQAGEFVREEMEHVRAGKHGARSRKQVVAIGLSKARRSGVDLPAPPAQAAGKKRTTKAATSKRGRPRTTRTTARRGRKQRG